VTTGMAFTLATAKSSIVHPTGARAIIDFHLIAHARSFLVSSYHYQWRFYGGGGQEVERPSLNSGKTKNINEQTDY